MSNPKRNYSDTKIVKRYYGARQPYSRADVTSVMVVAFDRLGRILLVTQPNKAPSYPAGHVEPHLDRTHQQTAAREVWEEARVTLRDIRLAGVIASSWKKKPSSPGGTFMLIMAARVASVHAFKPNAEITQRMFVGPEAYIHDIYTGQNRAKVRTVINKARSALNRRIS